MPNACTVEDFREAYVQAWKMLLKCVAIYRDGSKRSQPLNTSKTNEGGNKVDPPWLRLLNERRSSKSKSRSSAYRPTSPCAAACQRHAPPSRTSSRSPPRGYLTVGLFEDNAPGELFITWPRRVDHRRFVDAIGTLTSMALQYGVPLEALVKKFAHQRFEPSGFTKHPEIRNASSITDYVFRWMAIQFMAGYREQNSPNRNQPELAIPGLLEELKKKINRPVPELLQITGDDTDMIEAKPKNGGNGKHGNAATAPHGVASLNDAVAHFQQDAPTCPNCGHVAVRNGACYKCLNCGESLGCS